TAPRPSRSRAATRWSRSGSPIAGCDARVHRGRRRSGPPGRRTARRAPRRPAPDHAATGARTTAGRSGDGLDGSAARVAAPRRSTARRRCGDGNGARAVVVVEAVGGQLAAEDGGLDAGVGEVVPGEIDTR